MRFLSCTLIVSAAAIAQSLAGGFGGPAPFQNNSPLTTGIDGVYQASVSGSNTSGVISFTINDGSQPAPTILGLGSTERWVIFHNGAVYRGPVHVNFVDKRITGVLDTEGDFIGANVDPGVPGSYWVASNFASGDFNAQIDLKDPMGKFDGDGDLYPLGRLNAIEILTVTIDPVSGDLQYKMTPVDVTGSGQFIEFNVQGVRHSTATN